MFPCKVSFELNQLDQGDNNMLKGNKIGNVFRVKFVFESLLLTLKLTLTHCSSFLNINIEHVTTSY